MSVRGKMYEPNLSHWSTGSLQSTRQQDSDSCGVFVLMVNFQTVVGRAGNASRKKIAKNSPSSHHRTSAHHRTTLSGHIFAIKARNDNRKKLHSTGRPSWCALAHILVGLSVSLHRPHVTTVQYLAKLHGSCPAR